MFRRPDPQRHGYYNALAIQKHLFALLVSVIAKPSCPQMDEASLLKDKAAAEGHLATIKEELEREGVGEARRERLERERLTLQERLTALIGLLGQERAKFQVATGTAKLTMTLIPVIFPLYGTVPPADILLRSLVAHVEVQVAALPNSI